MVASGLTWFNVLVNWNLWVNSGLICFIRIDFCVVGVVFVFGWGLFWRLFELKSLWVLFELKSLFLDFGRMEKMVGLSSDRWWYENGGIVYKRKKKDGGSELRSMVIWRWWYSLPKKKRKKEDGGMKTEEWSSSHWWREPLHVVSKGALVWCCSDRGSHVCVFNYQNTMKTQFW